MNEHLANKLKHDKEKPPALVWENIEKQIENKKKPLLGGWWKFVALVILLPVMCLVGYVVYTSVKHQLLIVDNTELNETLKEDEDIAKTFDDIEQGAESSEHSSGKEAGNVTSMLENVLPEKKSVEQISDLPPLNTMALKETEVAEKPIAIEAREIEKKEVQDVIKLYDPVKDRKQSNRISIAAIVTPESVYRKLSMQNNEAAVEEQIAFRNSIEESRFGSTIGLRLGYDISPRITVNSGLFISHKGERIPGGNFPSSSPTGTDTTYEAYLVEQNSFRLTPIQNSLPGNVYISAENKYTYLHLPLEMQYTFAGKKLQWYASAGAGLNLLTSASATYIEMNVPGSATPPARIDYFNWLDLQIQGRLGAAYNLSENLSVLAEPVYKRSITSMLPAENNMQHFHHSYGVSFGIKWRPFSE